MAKENNDNAKSFFRWLDVIRAISGDKILSAPDIAKILGTSLRNAYYVVKALSAYGFFVNHNRLGYNLDATSPFFKDINDSVGLNVDQAFYLYRMLIGKDVDNPMAAGIRLKLKRFYHFDVLGGNKKNYGPYTNYMLLQSAMKDHKCVVLHNYASSNSLTVRDRLVEPFMFLGEDTDVRAYEVESGRNKTFKISRISIVEILDKEWENTNKHRNAFTDMFMYSGEVRHHVVLRLDVSSCNFMQEEYPHSLRMIRPDDDTHWLFETDVATYDAIARFILGLYDHIDVLGDKGLKKFLSDKIKRYGSGSI